MLSADRSLRNGLGSLTSLADPLLVAAGNWTRRFVPLTLLTVFGILLYSFKEHDILMKIRKYRNVFLLVACFLEEQQYCSRKNI